MNKKVMAILTATLVLCTAILTSVSASNPFTDVKDSDWFYNDVEYVRENKLMSGTSDSEFSPAGITTRGMIVTVLWRLDGSPVETGKDFDDVKEGAYYYDAVAWASNNGIVSGYSETTFGPDDTATREQLATIVYRYASYKKYDVSKEAELDKYVDKDQISSYAEKSIKWANASGLITGTSEETISPKNDVQRSQLAAILKRFCVNIVDAKIETPEATKAPEKEEEKDTTGSSGSSGGSGGGSGSAGGSGSSSTPTPTPEAPSQTSPVNVSVDTVDAKPGEEVTVAVNVDNNPGILGMRISVSYGDGVTLVSTSCGEAFDGIMDFTLPGDMSANPLRFLWDTVEIAGDEVKDGAILYLTFKVNDDAEAGDCDIKVEVIDMVDNSVRDLDSVVTNGAISISK